MRGFMQHRKEGLSMMKREKVSSIIRQTVQKKAVLSFGIALAVCGAVVVSLLPPLGWGKPTDRLSNS